MGIILWIVLGALAGLVASMVMRSPNGWLEDVILGIIGAFVGGLVMNLFGAPGVTGFNLYSLIVSILGAVIVIFLGRALHRGTWT